MSKRIYVGNLPFSATEDEVRKAFSEFGEVESVDLINDRHTGQPRGFGFVEMGDNDADKAIAALDSTDFGGRTLRVSLARERTGGGARGGGGHGRW